MESAYGVGRRQSGGVATLGAAQSGKRKEHHGEAQPKGIAAAAAAAGPAKKTEMEVETMSALGTKVETTLDNVRSQVESQFSEVIDAGFGSLKTTLLGLLGAFMVLENDLMSGDWLPQNISDVKTWIFAGVLAGLGIYSKSR